MPQPLMLKKLKLNGSMKTHKNSRTNTQKRCPFIIEHHPKMSLGGWNAKVGSKEIPGGIGKFSLGIQNEAGPWLTVLPRECTGHSKHPLPTTRIESIHGHQQMVYTENRLIIFFAAEEGKALYNQQKQDQEMTVDPIMNSLLQNSGLNWRK